MSGGHVLRHVAAAALSLVLLTGVAAPAFGAPTNAAIQSKRKQADAAQTKLDDLQTQLEMRYEELAQIEDSLTQTRQRISVTQAQLDAATTQLQQSQAQLDDRAMSIYRNGQVDMVEVFVGATSFSDLITRLDLMRRIGRSDAALVLAVKDARSSVSAAESALESREAEQVALRDQARIKQTEYQSAYEDQKAYFATLNSQLKQLINDERIRQEKLAAARAAAAAAKLEAAAKSTATSLPFDQSKLGAPHPDALVEAKKYLGVPYLWGGTTPSGFDCSGLMQYVYQKIRINLPRTSREQFHAGAYIPPNRLDLLAPGDLVFFGYNGDPTQIHHVGMYAGNGDFLQAPQTGDHVRISSLTGRIEARGDYVGAVRP
ncbi:MAG: NlpC/P60 family protein [Coriobacteriia bacterium]|nr:NlpC/P60 family protein [Coriobacteriia bacterium]